MKTKKYTNVFAEARKDPKYKGYLEEVGARIKLAEALYNERTFQ